MIDGGIKQSLIIFISSSLEYFIFSLYLFSISAVFRVQYIAYKHQQVTPISNNQPLKC